MTSIQSKIRLEKLSRFRSNIDRNTGERFIKMSTYINGAKHDFGTIKFDENTTQRTSRTIFSHDGSPIRIEILAHCKRFMR